MKRESKCIFQVKTEVAVYTGVNWNSVFAGISENSRIRFQTRTKPSLSFCFHEVHRKQRLDFLLSLITVMVGASQP